MRGRKQCRRRYVVPRDPRTPAQLRARAALAAASRFWSHSQQLTDQARDAWEAAANKTQSRPRLDQSGPLTGQQYFVGRQCARARSQGLARSGQCRADLPVCRCRGLSSPRLSAVLSSLPALLPGGPQLAPWRSAARTTWELRRTSAGPTRGHRQCLASGHRVREWRLAIATSPGSGQRRTRLPAPGGPPQARPACSSGACPAQFHVVPAAPLVVHKRPAGGVIGPLALEHSRARRLMPTRASLSSGAACTGVPYL